jgi:hypothetical protein
MVYIYRLLLYLHKNLLLLVLADILVSYLLLNLTLVNHHFFSLNSPDLSFSLDCLTPLNALYVPLIVLVFAIAGFVHF